MANSVFLFPGNITFTGNITFNGTVSIVGALSTSSSITAGGNLVATNDVVVGVADQLRWSTSRSRILSPSDGVLLLQNSTNNGFSKLQFGANDNNSPALTGSGSRLDVILALSGAFTGLKAATFTVSSAATLITSSAAFIDGAGALVGTLNNSPATGNPTKWIAINDNGTTRYIPTW